MTSNELPFHSKVASILPTFPHNVRCLTEDTVIPDMSYKSVDMAMRQEARDRYTAGLHNIDIHPIGI